MPHTLPNGLRIQEQTDGSELLIFESSKLELCKEAILNSSHNKITINFQQGYREDNIDFLSTVAGKLRGLHLPETKFDIRAVNQLHELEFLGIADNGRDDIDLSNFPKLETLAADFSSRLLNLETCKNLKSLSLTKYTSPDKDLHALPKLSKLENLALFLPKVESLSGIAKFARLNNLSVYRVPGLTSISALDDLHNLESLELEACKNISDFEALAKISGIKKIILSNCGEIESLDFLKRMPTLKYFSFWGTKVIDGDLSYLNEIEYVSFDNKRHYTHKIEDFAEKNNVWLKNTK